MEELLEENRENDEVWTGTALNTARAVVDGVILEADPIFSGVLDRALWKMSATFSQDSVMQQAVFYWHCSCLLTPRGALNLAKQRIKMLFGGDSDD